MKKNHLSHFKQCIFLFFIIISTVVVNGQAKRKITPYPPGPDDRNRASINYNETKKLQVNPSGNFVAFDSMHSLFAQEVLVPEKDLHRYVEVTWAQFKGLVDQTNFDKLSCQVVHINNLPRYSLYCQVINQNNGGEWFYIKKGGLEAAPKPEEAQHEATKVILTLTKEQVAAVHRANKDLRKDNNEADPMKDDDWIVFEPLTVRYDEDAYDTYGISFWKEDNSQSRFKEVPSGLNLNPAPPFQPSFHSHRLLKNRHKKE